MSTDRPGEPWPDRTYHGFAGPGGGAPDPPRRRLAGRTGAYVLAGGAAAVALGLAFGFWARPDLPKAGAAPAPAEPAAGQTVPIEVGKAAPLVQPHAAGKIQVLPPGAQAQARADAEATLPPAPQPPPPAAAVASPDVAPNPPPLSFPAPAPRIAAGADCSLAPSGAARMVCEDPELRAEDRALRRAYRRALASVDDPQALMADQRDWLAIREDAARHSRRALQEVYAQRLDELDRAVERPDDGGDDGDGGPG